MARAEARFFDGETAVGRPVVFIDVGIGRCDRVRFARARIDQRQPLLVYMLFHHAGSFGRWLERTGRVVTAAALLFCVAVGSFATSGIVIVKEVGLGIALAVAIDATLVRALLVPSLMALLGDWNWWRPGQKRG